MLVFDFMDSSTKNWRHSFIGEGLGITIHYWKSARLYDKLFCVTATAVDMVIRV